MCDLFINVKNIHVSNPYFKILSPFPNFPTEIGYLNTNEVNSFLIKISFLSIYIYFSSIPKRCHTPKTCHVVIVIDLVHLIGVLHAKISPIHNAGYEVSQC